MEMKRIFLIAGLLSVLLPAFPVSAHQVLSDHGVQGILHINPNDTPVAGQPMQLMFYLNSSDPTFSVPDCGCHVAITRQGKQIATPSTRISQGLLTANVTLSAVGTYTVQLTGSGFTLPYDIRVDKNPSAHTSNEIAVITASTIGFLALCVLCYWYVRVIQRRDKS